MSDGIGSSNTAETGRECELRGGIKRKRGESIERGLIRGRKDEDASTDEEETGLRIVDDGTKEEETSDVSCHSDDDTGSLSSAVSQTSGISSWLHRLHEGGSGTGGCGPNRYGGALFGKGSTDPRVAYVQGLEERIDAIFERLQKSNGYLLRDVIRYETPSDASIFIDILCKTRYKRSLLLVSRDTGNREGHIHVCHDCPYSGRQCRCKCLEDALKIGGVSRDPSGRRRNSCRSRRKTHILALIFYHATETRFTVCVRQGGKLETFLRKGINLEKERFANYTEGAYVEAQVSRIRDRLRELDGGSDFSEDELTQELHTGQSSKRRPKMEKKACLQLQIVNMVKQYPISPPEAICMTPIWRSDDKLRFRNTKHTIVADALTSLKYELLGWSFDDFESMYRDVKCKPYFSSLYCPLDEYYYSIDESVEVLDKLIHFQFDNDVDGVTEFYQCLYNVIERKIPKLNALVVHSQPSCGKNFFFDAFFDYFMNVGHLCVVNKNNNFGMMDAEGRRLVHWNEPNYAPENIDKCKELLGGDKSNVEVKYASNSAVFRTPFIITTNNIVSFMTLDAFKDRLRVFRWKPAPYLADYDKKPHPLAVYPLMCKHGLIKQ